MQRMETQRTRTVGKVAVALIAGLVVLGTPVPIGRGIDRDSPTCFGMFSWYTVPCGGWPAVAAGALTAGVVALGLWLKDRRK